jgi:hypothetical protein
MNFDTTINHQQLRIQLKDFMDEEAKINKDTITKFKAIDKGVREHR